MHLSSLRVGSTVIEALWLRIHPSILSAESQENQGNCHFWHECPHGFLGWIGGQRSQWPQKHHSRTLKLRRWSRVTVLKPYSSDCNWLIILRNELKCPPACRGGHTNPITWRSPPRTSTDWPVPTLLAVHFCSHTSRRRATRGAWAQSAANRRPICYSLNLPVLWHLFSPLLLHCLWCNVIAPF